MNYLIYLEFRYCYENMIKTKKPETYKLRADFINSDFEIALYEGNLF